MIAQLQNRAYYVELIPDDPYAGPDQITAVRLYARSKEHAAQLARDHWSTWQVVSVWCAPDPARPKLTEPASTG